MLEDLSDKILETNIKIIICSELCRLKTYIRVTVFYLKQKYIQ